MSGLSGCLGGGVWLGCLDRGVWVGGVSVACLSGCLSVWVGVFGWGCLDGGVWLSRLSDLPPCDVRFRIALGHTRHGH